MPSFRLVAIIVAVSAATYVGIEHYKARKAG
jgi:hypothetical protein